MIQTIALTMTLTEQPSGQEDDDAFFGTVDINGVPHHITLIEVEESTRADGSLRQEGFTSWGDNCLAALTQFESSERPYSTITVADRRFVLVVTPFLK